ncbi:MAG TPA: hypothetical protein VHA37_04380 [Candidatus Saccharimonadales bacterium]|nr:hypothetical protein [Candidatus Saccharimonadales bacterium]
MSRKLVWPVAKRRQDGTPAIWLTHTNWLLLKTGIVREYLDNREGHGRNLLRREARQKLGADWRSNAHLKSWEYLDSWPTWLSNANAAMELFVAGYEAWKHVKGLDIKDWTPESLRAAGDHHEQRGREEELKELGKQKEAA